MKTPSKNLFNLIKTLTKSEKRYFKIEASKHGGDKKNHYVKLFDAIEAMNEYDEEALKKNVGAGDKITTLTDVGAECSS